MAIAKNVQEFIAHQRAAVSANPECGTSHYNLAVGLLGLKKYEEAEKELCAAIECSPNLAEAYVQLGGSACSAGTLKAALNSITWRSSPGPGLLKGMGILDLQNFNWEISTKRFLPLKKR